MPIAHPGPPKYQLPRLNGSELHIHAHRARAGIALAERWLATIFLRRYVISCARARRFERLRNAIDLLVDISRR